MAPFGIPDSDSVTRQFILNENTPFIITETYSSIRTNLIAATRNSPYKGIVITSQCRNEGKTTTAVNLAIMMSRLDKRVLLIDADLRRSGVHSVLRLKNRLGLTSILRGECDVYSALNKDIRNNFHVITTGKLPKNPADIIASTDMERLIRLLYEFFDYIIIDTPPLCVANDALLFGGFTAGAALVVRENKTTHSDLDAALSTISLSKTNLLGVIKTYCNVKYDKASDYRSAIAENIAELADNEEEEDGDEDYD